MLKEILIKKLTEQVTIGESLKERLQSIYNEEGMNKLLIDFKDWDNLNSQILNNGFKMKQLFSMYSMGNINTTIESYLEKSNYVINALPKKLHLLSTAIGTAQSSLNTDLLPLSTNIINLKNITQSMKKLFISHSSEDDNKIKPFLKLLNLIGVPHANIFYCSVEGYGLKPGENIIDGLKRELNNEVFALFMLSENFYASAYCVCEMGAIWIKSHKQIPILIPPTDFSHMKGVFPNTIALKLDDKSHMNTLKTELEQYFEIIPMDYSRWETFRDDYFKELTEALSKTK